MTIKGFGAQLYASLPKVYRARDNGDLEGYLDAVGELLDLLGGALGQQLANSFPDHPDAQRWALPYLAELVGVRPVSPEESGQRREITDAIRLRQRKGTLGAVVDLAAMIGQFGWTEGDAMRRPHHPILVQEGWKRVAVTPRIGDLLLPESAYGARPMGAPKWESDPRLKSDPRQIVRHAGLPAVTVDFRYASRRVRSSKDDKGSATSQANPHGIPCFAADATDRTASRSLEVPFGGAEDVSRRTPDLRTPTWRAGHVHPRRILVHHVPFPGFFPPGWDDKPTGLTPASDGVYRRCVVGSGVTITLGGGGDDSAVYRLEDCLIEGGLNVLSGRIELVRCAVAVLDVEVADRLGAPALSAVDCLFLGVRSVGTARLVGVTIVGDVSATRFQVSDSLLSDSVPSLAGAQDHCFRYSRVPAGPALDARYQYRCFSDRPSFFSTRFAPPGGTKPFPVGAFVLHPESGPRLLGGAEDGGEVGAYHHRYHAARVRAVEDKLREHLPLGQLAVLIPDPKLACDPPSVT